MNSSRAGEPFDELDPTRNRAIVQRVMMDPDRWRQIEELYQSAVESDLAERARLLANADPELRREVVENSKRWCGH